MELSKGSFPLQGVTVLALEQAVAAPLATRQLADLGARVIKIERPGTGDFARAYDTSVHGQSSHFIWLNRSKESLTLDIKSEAGQVILHRLCEEADVFVHNLAPGAVDRLGLGRQGVQEQFPQLITCEISGYGRGGPYTLRKAYDLLIECEAGFLSITGTTDTPSKAGISVADIAAGMYAFSNILTSLYLREKTGKGAYIEVSMLEALGEWMGYPYLFTNYGGKELQRTGSSHASIYPYGSFGTKDGLAVFFGLQNDREWDRFCRIVIEDNSLGENPRYHTNANRFLHKKELDAVLRRALLQFTADQLIARLDKANIASARLNGMKEFKNHAQLQARKRWRTVETPGGAIEALIPPTTMDGWDVRMDPVPSIGEHTDSILKQLGFSTGSIDLLRNQGVI